MVRGRSDAGPDVRDGDSGGVGVGAVGRGGAVGVATRGGDTGVAIGPGAGWRGAARGGGRSAATRGVGWVGGVTASAPGFCGILPAEPLLAGGASATRPPTRCTSSATHWRMTRRSSSVGRVFVSACWSCSGVLLADTRCTTQVQTRCGSTPAGVGPGPFVSLKLLTQLAVWRSTMSSRCFSGDLLQPAAPKAAAATPARKTNLTMNATPILCRQLRRGAAANQAVAH
jgi:hypothetical protein